MLVKNKGAGKTTYTPELKFSLDGKLSIKGRWAIEASEDFINTINDWLISIKSSSNEVKTVDIYLEYIKNSNKGILISLLRKVQLIAEETNSLTIYWHYEEGDEDIREFGDYISKELGVPFVFIRNEE